MDTPSSRSLPELARYVRPLAFGLAAATSLLFHFFLSYNPVGWPLGLFGLFVATSILTVVHRTRSARNSWALLFLIPLVSACLATSLYSSEVVQGVSFILVALSLASLAYWLTAPSISWHEGVPLWKTAVFLESTLPFRRYQTLFTELGSERKVNDKLIFQILTGLVVAGPVLVVFLSLFAQGDQFFRETIGQLVALSWFDAHLGRLFADLVLFMFGSAFLWNVVRRSQEHAATKEPRGAFQELVAARAFIGAVCTLFVIFAAFQLFYLFQSSDYLLSQGQTYADYARSGYGQLCTAAASAGLMLLTLWKLTGLQDRWLRLGSVVIGMTSMISTLSAGKRLWLYVDAYGLTLSRAWGMQFLVLILVLFATLLWSLYKHWNLHQLVATGSAITLGLLSLTLLVNHEALVARYNLERHITRKGSELDLVYLVNSLSADAVPTIASYLARPDWHDDHTTWRGGYAEHPGDGIRPREQVYYTWNVGRTPSMSLAYPSGSLRFLQPTSILVC